MSRIADDWRKGQIAYNVLAVARPDLTNEINNTDLDPFYDDNKLDDFWKWLQAALTPAGDDE